VRCQNIFLAVSFSFLLFFSFSQTATKNFAEILKEYRTADEYYTRALSLNTDTPDGEKKEAWYNQMALYKFRQIEKELPPGNPLIDSLHFFLALKMGELEHYFDSLSLAVSYYEKAIAIKKSLPQLADSFVFKAYVLSGNIYFIQNRLDEANNSFRKAEVIQDRTSQKIRESERLYNALGVLHFQSGNYLQAGNYFRKASETLDPNGPYYADFLVNYSINSAIALFKLENFDSALVLLQQLLPYRIHSNEIHNNLGLIYFRKGKFPEALREYRHVHYGNRLDIGLQNDRANAWLSLKIFDSAQSSLRNAEELNTIYNANQSSADHGLTLKIYGDLFSLQGKTMEALKFYQQALHQFYPSFSNESSQGNPKKFTGVFSYINLFNTLTAKAVALNHLYQQHHDFYYAKQALETYTAAFALIDYIARSYDSDEARLFLEKSRYDIHTIPIDIAFQLYRQPGDDSFLEKAYVMDQQNKASVLAFNDQRNQGSDRSTPLRKTEQKLKTDITRLSLMSAHVQDSTAVAKASREIGELEIQLGKVQDSISAIFPVAIAIPSSAELQQILSKDTKLISYHLSEGQLTVFTFDHHQFRGYQKPVYPGFKSDLEYFIKVLHDGSDSVVQDSSPVDRLSSFLLDGFIEDEKRLVIIPDDELNYLPFEALIKGGKFLVENFSIQYQYSTALLKKEGSNFKKSTTIAFAPFAGNDVSVDGIHLSQLPFSLDEVNHLKGEQFVNSAATKESFLDHLNQGDIIHLATHAVAGDSSGSLSYIAFAPGNVSSRENFLLYAPEIYNLSLSKTRLVILSACETGYGKLVRGEGVMSVSRAFAYAGCRDIITSLWKADDEATAYLTRKIHAYLQEGLSIDAALQRAKKDYLKSPAIHPRKKQPSYWAHLVFIGNYQPASKVFPWLWIFLPLFFGLILLFMLRKRLQHS
jgi:tetratricopeptide (TPR) repeat protein